MNFPPVRRHVASCLMAWAALFCAHSEPAGAQPGQNCRCADDHKNPAPKCSQGSQPLISRGEEDGASGLAGVYEFDDRLDYFRAQPPWHAALDATIAVIPKVRIKEGSRPLNFTKKVRTQQEADDEKWLCCGESFCEQPAAAVCSAVLVGKNKPILLGAAHCFGATEWPVETVQFVLGYRLQHGDNTWKFDDMRSCPVKAYSMWPTDKPTIALVELDCPADANLPASVTLTNPDRDLVLADTPLYATGYPRGMPVKFAGGGKLLPGTLTEKSFSATLDVFRGGSGGGVFMLDANGQPTLLGILEAGLTDLGEVTEPSGISCWSVCVYPKDGYQGKGEIVTRLTRDLLDEIAEVDKR